MIKFRQAVEFHQFFAIFSENLTACCLFVLHLYLQNVLFQLLISYS
ncbi:hypothetical protein HMPREF0027_1687 [Actinobacillus ureae ATCC 25976]|uniref:Uncharacterized protein n=1 Tax=Actinobacillus ureae ATCC 25976 TaxID=887324 RepID=E8KIM0_9PAST|nr:hypothetical protein HMPREF0027_1687 [Actinobacillus ureae ATCC 25976]